MGAPFTPEVHLRVKRQLNWNLNVLAGLHDHLGRKLRFDPNTGRFYDDADGSGRSGRNSGTDYKDSATSEEMFVYPLLVTFYECKKLMLKVAAGKVASQGKKPYDERVRSPQDAWRDARRGLVYLRDKTYDTGFKSLFKGSQRTKISEVLTNVDRMESAGNRNDLDAMIVSWVPFGLPATVHRIVSHAYYDSCVKYYVMSFPPSGDNDAIRVLSKHIYNTSYKTGGAGGHGAHSSPMGTESYWRQVNTTASRFGATAQPQHIEGSLGDVLNGRAWLHKGKNNIYQKATLLDVGFVHFFHPSWGGNGIVSRGRVYLHLTPAGALAGLEKIFETLASRPSGELANFGHFKTSSPPMLAKYADSVVMWTSDADTARSVGAALVKPLRGLLASGLPTGVKPLNYGTPLLRIPSNPKLPSGDKPPEHCAVGIGISTEPETSFDPRMQAMPHLKDPTKEAYSYGTHRSEIIARGILQAYRQGSLSKKGNPRPNTWPDFDTCFRQVALKFTEYGLNVFKPYQAAVLP